MSGLLTTVLKTPMVAGNDADAATVGEYLQKLLADVWKYDEGFDGKRPFGNSGWKGEVYHALVAAGLTPGTIHAEGWLDDVDEDAADALIQAAIAHAFEVAS